MNYLGHYENLINSRINRTKLNCYFEVHHIIPKSIGGTDEPDNLVKLTPEEHFIAHLLLHKIFKTNSLLEFAYYNMRQKYVGKKVQIRNNKQFGADRRQERKNPLQLRKKTEHF